MMANTKYTIVGMSSSGKTCFLTAIYMKMVTGVDGFTLWTTPETQMKFNHDILALCDSDKGLGRFPAATPNAENAVKPYEFRLLYNLKDLISFDIIDYAGGALANGGPVYHQLEQSLAESTAMFIFIDGALLCDESQKVRRDRLYYKCALHITPLIQHFADSHGGKLPPIVFVVTKADLCGDYIDDHGLVQIIRDLFNPAFSEGITSYICSVSLGNSISDDGYRGECSPVNVHIPLFIGSFHEYRNRCIVFKEKIEAANKNIAEQQEKQEKILSKKQRNIFKDKKAIAECKKSIEESEESLRSNQKLLEDTQALYTRFGEQLKKESENFKTFICDLRYTMHFLTLSRVWSRPWKSWGNYSNNQK